jgi:hypothetical protein
MNPQLMFSLRLKFRPKRARGISTHQTNKFDYSWFWCMNCCFALIQRLIGSLLVNIGNITNKLCLLLHQHKSGMRITVTSSTISPSTPLVNSLHKLHPPCPLLSPPHDIHVHNTHTRIYALFVFHRDIFRPQHWPGPGVNTKCSSWHFLLPDPNMGRREALHKVNKEGEGEGEEEEEEGGGGGEEGQRRRQKEMVWV